MGEPFPEVAVQEPPTTSVSKVTSVRALDVPFTATDSDEDILRGVSDIYTEALRWSSELEVFIDARSLKHPGLIDQFRLGLGNRTLGLRIPKTNRAKGRQLRERLQALGVLRKDSGHEHLNGCLVVPTFDLEGHIVNLYGRRIERARSNGPGHLWCDPSRRGILNPGAFESSALVVTASIVDALTCWSFGIPNVTSIFGLDGPTEDLIAAITSHRTKKITLVFRRNHEAQLVAERLGSEVAALGVEVFVALLPQGMDLNDYARSVPSPSEALSQIVRSAEWVGGLPKKAPSSTPKTESEHSGSAAAETPQSSSRTGRRSEPLTSTSTATHPDEPQRQSSETKTPGEELVFIFGERRWRVRGLATNTSPGTLKLNIFVSRETVGFHVDQFDLYSARHRTAFVRAASDELHVDEAVLKSDMGNVLLRLEQAQDALLRSAVDTRPKPNEMTELDRDAALDLLRSPHLLDRIGSSFEELGIVGERENLLLGYLATISRKLERPLAVVVQSTSAAGKSSIVDAVLELVPEEDRFAFSAMTGQTLYYMGGSALRHKVLSIAEDEGAARASYALKLLQSEGSLTIASTGKDPGTGRLISQEYKVEGPVAILMTTTRLDLDEELLSRCIVLAVDESVAQTKRIHAHQGEAFTLKKLLQATKRDDLVRLHQNAQRLIRCVPVVNPFAADLGYSDFRLRTRRDYRKLLTLVEVVTVIHQHQRAWKRIEHEGRVVEYLETTKADVEIAHALARKAGLVETQDLPPNTVRVLERIEEIVSVDKLEGGRFTRRQLREALGLGDTQLWTHLRRLVRMEYLVTHREGRSGRLVYELLSTPSTRISGTLSGSEHDAFGQNSGRFRDAFGVTNSHESSNDSPSSSMPCDSTQERTLGADESIAIVGTPRHRR